MCKQITIPSPTPRPLRARKTTTITKKEIVVWPRYPSTLSTYDQENQTDPQELNRFQRHARPQVRIHIFTLIKVTYATYLPSVITTKTLGISLLDPALHDFWRNRWYAAIRKAWPVLELVNHCFEAFLSAWIILDVRCGLEEVGKKEWAVKSVAIERMIWDCL